MSRQKKIELKSNQYAVTVGNETHKLTVKPYTKKNGTITYMATFNTGTGTVKPVYKTITGQSVRAVIDEVKDYFSNINEGIDVYNKAMFGPMADEWLTVTKEGNVSESTLKEYKAAIKHIKSRYEKTPLRDITYTDFQTFINDLAKMNPNTHKPASKRFLKDIRDITQSVCKYAKLNKIANVPDFFESVVIPKTATVTKRRALTYEEIQMVIDTPHRAQTPSMIMLFSGLRRGEVIPLTWSDIDFDNSFISINKSVAFDTNSGIIKNGGKTENAERLVPIPPILDNYLKKQMETDYNEYRSQNPGVSELFLKSKFKKEPICKNAKSKIHTMSSWNKMWDSYMLELNLKYVYNYQIDKNDPGLHDKMVKDIHTCLKQVFIDFTPHYLRHTFATLLYLQDVNVVMAKEIMGHADIQTTVNIYTDFKTINKLKLPGEYKEKLEKEYKISV